MYVSVIIFSCTVIALLSSTFCICFVHLCQEWTLCSGGQSLDRLENNSRTVKGAKVIGQEKEALALILEPVKTFSKGMGNPIRWMNVPFRELQLNSNCYLTKSLSSLLFIQTSCRFDFSIWLLFKHLEHQIFGHLAC